MEQPTMQPELFLKTQLQPAQRCSWCCNNVVATSVTKRWTNVSDERQAIFHLWLILQRLCNVGSDVVATSLKRLVVDWETCNNGFSRTSSWKVDRFTLIQDQNDNGPILNIHFTVSPAKVRHFCDICRSACLSVCYILHIPFVYSILVHIL